jgi:hypothetical protein
MSVKHRKYHWSCGRRHAEQGFDDDDAPECGCVPCANFVVCGESARAPYRRSPRTLRGGGVSGTAAFGHSCIQNEFPVFSVRAATAADQDCPVCFEAAATVVDHPSGCGHTTCVECFKRMWKTETRLVPHPEEFGYQRGSGPYAKDSHRRAFLRWQFTRNGRYRSAQYRQWLWTLVDVQVAAHEERDEREQTNSTACPLCRAPWQAAAEENVHRPRSPDHHLSI